MSTEKPESPPESIPESPPEAPPEPQKYIDLTKVPSNFRRMVFTYLNPLDCYNLAQVSPAYWKMVRKRTSYQIQTLYLRFDGERSCCVAYFVDLPKKKTAHVFYSWKEPGGKRVHWNNSYVARRRKLQSYLFNSRTHPQEVRDLQSTIQGPVNYISGLIHCYRQLRKLFIRWQPYIHLGVNVNDRITCLRYEQFKITLPETSFLKLIASHPARLEEVGMVLKSVGPLTRIKVGHNVGAACLHPKLLNAYSIVLDDPEWLTGRELLRLNNAVLNIGHNQVTAKALHLFFSRWIACSPRQMKLKQMDLMLSAEAFQNKNLILKGLPWFKWDPEVREGEFFEVSRQIYHNVITEPRSFHDCKYAADIYRSDGVLGSILFHGRRLLFFVWHDRFPYHTLQCCRLIASLEEKQRCATVKALKEWVKERGPEKRAKKRKKGGKESSDGGEPVEKKNHVLEIGSGEPV